MTAGPARSRSLFARPGAEAALHSIPSASGSDPDLLDLPEDAEDGGFDTSGDEPTLERLSAVLRWRKRWVQRQLSAAEAQACDLAPVLFQAAYTDSGMRGEPPGVEHVRISRAWGRWSRAFGLSPPSGVQRGRRTVACVLALARPGQIRIWACASAGLGPREVDHIRQRAAAVQRILEQGGVRATVGVLLPGTPEAARLAPDFAVFGLLLGGRLPVSAWVLAPPPPPAASTEPGSTGSPPAPPPAVPTPPATAGTRTPAVPVPAVSPTPAAAAGTPTDPEAPAAGAAAMLVSAPTPLSAVILALGAERLPSAARLLTVALQRYRSRIVSDPEFLAALWVELGTRDPSLALRAVAAGGVSVTTRRMAARRLSHLGMQDTAVTTSGLLSFGRELAIGAATSVRRHFAPRTLVRRLLRENWLWAGQPVGLLTAIGAKIQGPLRVVPQLDADGVCRCHQVLDASGAVLTQGLTRDQALARAAALTGRAGYTGEGPAGVSVWSTLQTRLAQPPTQPCAWLLAESRPIGGGVPADPLNRGPERQTMLAHALLAQVSPGVRPGARVVSPSVLPAELVGQARAGTRIEVLPDRVEARPLASRLERLVRTGAGLSRSGDEPIPYTIESDGDVFVLRGGRTYRYSLQRVLERPRRLQPDIEAPDLSIAPEVYPPTRGFSGGEQCIGCLGTLSAPGRVTLFMGDRTGTFLRESVPLARLGEHLNTGADLLRSAVTPAIMAVRMTPELAEAAGKLGNEPRRGVPVRVFGRLPHRIEVEIMGERFGGRRRLGWAAAGEFLLSAWPTGEEGRIQVRHIEVTGADQKPLVGLSLLYVRSLVLRRLETHAQMAARPR